MNSISVFIIFQVVHNKLMACLNHLVPKSAEAVDIGSTNGASSHRMWYPAKEVSVESLIIGALESAFWEMDQQIGEDKKRYKMLGNITFWIILFVHLRTYGCSGCNCTHSFPAPARNYTYKCITYSALPQSCTYTCTHAI